jgi:hypothetical protein
MPKKNLLLPFMLIFSSSTFGQEICNCSADLNFVIEKIEKEHPGFSENVTEKNREFYKSLKDSLIIETNKENVSKDLCQKILKKYICFIKDKHLQIYDPIKIGEADYEKNFVAKNLPKYKDLENSIGYIKIPSFNYKLWKELDHFYDSITPIIKTKQKIILDIRNNGGGGERMYSQLLKILKSNSKKIKIAVVFNNKCASACEEVALILTENKNIKTFGENTNGMVAYGFVKEHKTPNCGFTFIITTKKYSSRLKYEFLGVQPEFILEKEKESDWIKIIEQKLNE